MDAKFWSGFQKLIHEDAIDPTDLEAVGREIVGLGQIIERLRHELRRRQAELQRRMNVADTRQDA